MFKTSLLTSCTLYLYLWCRKIFKIFSLFVLSAIFWCEECTEREMFSMLAISIWIQIETLQHWNSAFSDTLQEGINGRDDDLMQFMLVSLQQMSLTECQLVCCCLWCLWCHSQQHYFWITLWLYALFLHWHFLSWQTTFHWNFFVKEWVKKNLYLCSQWISFNKMLVNII